MESELTKISKEEEERISKEDYNGYVYSSSNHNKLLSCSKPSFGDEIDIMQLFKIRLDGVRVIGDYACSDKHCSFMFIEESIDIGLPEGITHIGDYAFKGRCLVFVQLPKSLVYLGRNPFAQTSLFEVQSRSKRFIVKDNCIIDINKNKLIHNVSENGTVTIPQDIKEIGEYSFSRKDVPFKKLYFDDDEDTMEVVVPSSVQKIGDCAFKNCNLRNITFIGKPQTIGLEIFLNCTFLERIYVPQGTKSYFIGLLPKYADVIDDRGDAVNNILFRNILASKGIDFFYKVDCHWKSNVYGYIKDNHFHFSDEIGRELTRDVVGFPNGVLVFEIQEEQYIPLKEGDTPENDAFAINDHNKISWFENGEDLYYRVTNNQIIIHKSNELSDYSSYHKEIEHSARFYGDNSDTELTSIDENWYYYKENGMIRVLNKGELNPDYFDYIEEHFYSSFSSTFSFIIVSKDDKWGFFTIEGEYVEPKYSSVECLHGNSDFYVIQGNDGCFGVVNLYGEEIIEPTNKEFVVRGFLNEHPNLIAISERYIYTAECEYSSFSKRKFLYTWNYEEIPEIDNCKVSTVEISKYCRYRWGNEEECWFINICKEDGKYFIFDNNCVDLTNSDELDEWEEVEGYRTSEIIYGELPEERDKTVDNDTADDGFLF